MKIYLKGKKSPVRNFLKPTKCREITACLKLWLDIRIEKGFVVS